MAAYLTILEAADRLGEYEIHPDSVALVTEADLRAASDALDAHAPFKGRRPEGQARQFPREGEDSVPESALDWVALRALSVASDEEPAIISESAGRTSVTYANPKTSQNSKRMQGLLKPLLRTTGTFK